jgi:amino acid transporter
MLRSRTRRVRTTLPFRPPYPPDYYLLHRKPASFMSKRVIFTCTLLLLLGLWGGYETTVSIARGVWHFNLFALFLPVSIALFMALPASRIAATVVFSILYLFLALVLIGTSMPNVRVIHSDLPLANPYPFMVVCVVMFACVLALLHWMLYSPPFDEHLSA